MDAGSPAHIDDEGLVVCALCSRQNEHDDYEPAWQGTPGGSAQRKYERLRRREHESTRKELPLAIALVAVAALCGYFVVQIVAAIVNHRFGEHTTALAKPVFVPSTAHEVGAFLAIVAGVGMARMFWSRRQSTTAWAKGAQGERVVAARLAKVVSKGVSVICDRRIPGGRANIDFIAVGPTGIYVIDAKVVAGRIAARTTGPIWNRGPVKLFIGGRNRTSFIEGMDRQVRAVATALWDIPETRVVPIRPLVVLVGAEWGWFQRPLRVQGVWVGWPEETAKVVSRAGPLNQEVIRQLRHVLASQLPEA
jgi:hypothetical protein